MTYSFHARVIYLLKFYHMIIRSIRDVLSPSRVPSLLHQTSQNFRQSRLNEIAIDLSTSSLPFSPVAAANTEKCDEARCTCGIIYKFDVPAVAFTSRFFTLIALSHVIRFSRNSLRPGVSLTLLMFGGKKE